MVAGHPKLTLEVPQLELLLQCVCKPCMVFVWLQFSLVMPLVVGVGPACDADSIWVLVQCMNCQLWCCCAQELQQQ